MFTFLLAAITVFIPAHARYPDEILHKYFGDEDLWDTVTQKCINDRQWDHYFMCAYGAGSNPLLTSDSDANDLNENGDEYYSSAWTGYPATGTSGTRYPATGTSGTGSAETTYKNFPPPDSINPSKQPSNVWLSPYGDDLSKYWGPNVGSLPLSVAHVIPKPTLIRFYNDMAKEYNKEVFMNILEPLFDAIAEKLVC